MKLYKDIMPKILRENIIGLIIFLVIVIWFNYVLTNALHQNDGNKNSNISNHFLNNFHMTETDSKGKIKWILVGERLEKFPDSERSEVFMPKMKIKSSDTESWNITAKHALDPESLFNSIYLTDNVVFDKFDDLAANQIHITTSKAIIYPNTEIVETTEFATIVTPDSTTTGNGIIADMKKGHVKILSNAKRISFADEQSQQLEGDRMMYDLEKKSWVLLKKDNQNDKIEINKRVKTILKTLKKNTDE